MTSIPQCMHCKNGKIENGTIICKKYDKVPDKISNGMETCRFYNDLYEFYKENENDKIWWVSHYIILDPNKEISSENIDKTIGEHLFSFDKKKIYNLFEDYPWNLSKEEKEIFDKENPHWKDFFKDR